MRHTDKYIEDALGMLHMIRRKAKSVPGRKLSENDQTQIDNVTPLDDESIHSTARAAVSSSTC